MIIFEMDKSRTFFANTTIQGIDPGKLKYRLCLEIKGMEYGFPLVLEGEQLKTTIPPLSSVVNGMEPGEYNAKIEAYGIIEEDSGFYMNPWEDIIQVKSKVRLKAKVADEVMEAKIKVDVKPTIEEKVVEKVTEVKQEVHKNSRLRKVFA